MTDLRERLRREAGRQPPPEGAFEALVERRERRRRRQRVTSGLVVVFITAGILGASVLGLSGLREDDEVAGPAAEPARDLTLGPGEYFYVKTSYSAGRGVETWESWWAADGSGRYEILSDSDDYGSPKPGTFGPGEFPVPGDLSDLSTEHAVLAEQIRARSAPDGASPVPEVTPGPGHAPESGTLWRAVEDLLRFPNADPELRAALFAFTADIPGVNRVDGARDPGGREAIMLELDYGGYVTRIYFDPESLQPVGTQDIEAGYGRREMVIDSGIVSSTTERPSGDQWLAPPATSKPTGHTETPE